MAENEKKEKAGGRPANLTAMARKLPSLVAGTLGLQNGEPPQLAERQNAQGSSLKEILSGVQAARVSVLGPNPLEFFSAVSASLQRRASQEDRKGGGGKFKVEEFLNVVQERALNDLFMREQPRMDLYEMYEAFDQFIPQVSQALDAYADNIIAADSFQTSGEKTVIVEYAGSTQPDDVSRVKEILVKHGFLRKMRDWVREACQKGDCFVQVRPIDRAVRRHMALREGGVLPVVRGPLLESASPSEVREEMLRAWGPLSEAEGWSVIVSEAARVGSDFANSIQFSNSGMMMADEAEEMGEAFDFADRFASLEEAGPRLLRTGQGDGDPEGSQVEKAKESAIPLLAGSSVRRLDPRRVVKLNVGDQCFGYFYMDGPVSATMARRPRANVKGYEANLIPSGTPATNALPGSMRNIDLDTSVGDMAKDKETMVADAALRAIGKRIGAKFLEKNVEFREIVLALLDARSRDRSGRRDTAKVVYLAPDEVIHFRPDSEGEYGTSLLFPALFMGKLFLANLTNTIMLKLTRGPDKRVYYVDVGMENDLEATVNAFMNEVKSKEIRFDQLGNIGNIFRNVGVFNDIFVPMTDGQRPVDMETISGMDVQMDGDFMEFLRKSISSAIGVPANLSQYSEEVEFARQLSMQNGRFAGRVAGLQLAFAAQATEGARWLVRNEVRAEQVREADGSDLPAEGSGSKARKEDARPDPGKLKVAFRAPYALRVAMLSDEMNQSRDLIDFSLQAFLGENADDPNVKKHVYEELAKMLAPTLPWEDLRAAVAEGRRRAAEQTPEPGAGGADGGAGGGF